MVTITYFKNALLIEGHANLQPAPHDILCAGISAISMGALNWFDQADIKVTINDGSLLLIINHCSKQNIDYLTLIKTQLNALDSEMYKPNLKFINKNINYN